MFNSPLNDKRYHLEDYSMIGLWVASKGAFGEKTTVFIFSSANKKQAIYLEMACSFTSYFSTITGFCT
ncbi:hypothetical protein DY353_01275 [Listeria monocytogenes]|nr:hypothetical protein DY368_01275 [Listeria monocytogenes]REL00487.1 hypothetical protein DY332_04125 [Listeria monocytogenes]REL07678.1 hypothetical protein DY408_01275 [Listeria monocytogenes]REL09182.1 hypothetical protein DY353_01275 [Listeria monocytogenes]REL11937.1 hypothetical protein DY388_04125 [Listeria monocytogenes]